MGGFTNLFAKRTKDEQKRADCKRKSIEFLIQIVYDDYIIAKGVRGMKCKRCGTELRNDDEFCYRCGQRTTVGQRIFSSKAFVGSLIAILVVVAAGILTYFIWTGKIQLPDWGSADKEPVAEESTDRAENGNENDQKEKEDKGGEQPEESQEEPEPTEKPEPTATPFEPSDVTVEKKRELKAILGHAKPYLALSALYYEGGRHKFHWGDRPASMMSLYYLHAEKGTVRYGEAVSSIEKKVKKEMKDVFGKYAKCDLTYGSTYPEDMYRPTGNTLVYNLSRMGTRVRNLDLEKVIEYKEGRYRVIVNGYITANSNPDSQPQAEQKYTLYMEKSESAKYKYFISKVALYEKKHGKVKATTRKGE